LPRFSAAVLDAAFLDVLTTMGDPSIHLVQQEYAEWGNPQCDLAVYAAQRSYSPYDNVHRGKSLYPPVLLLSALRDTRVGFWESAKYAARLRHEGGGENIVFLRTDVDGGAHCSAGKGSTIDKARRTALVYTFLLASWGIGNEYD
jgi:oligopeptidase B